MNNFDLWSKTFPISIGFISEQWKLTVWTDWRYIVFMCICMLIMQLLWKIHADMLTYQQIHFTYIYSCTWILLDIMEGKGLHKYLFHKHFCLKLYSQKLKEGNSSCCVFGMKRSHHLLTMCFCSLNPSVWTGEVFWPTVWGSGWWITSFKWRLGCWSPCTVIFGKLLLINQELERNGADWTSWLFDN